MNTRNKFIKEIKILNSLGELIIKYDDLKRKGLMTWVQFKEQAHKINSESVFYVKEYFEGFMENNKHNSLPYSSSGSFLTAMTEIDHLSEAEYFSELGDEIEEIIEKEYEF